MGKKEYTNKDKQKELKKFFDAKRKKNFSGVDIKPSKNYKGRINNLALPEDIPLTELSLDAIEKEIKKQELQKKRYGRELKENEIEVRAGGLITKKYANPIKIVDNRKKK